MKAGLQGSESISIHTLRVEGDRRIQHTYTPLPISIHTLRVEGDNLNLYIRLSNKEFQSTPSAWRVTGSVCINKTL